MANVANVTLRGFTTLDNGMIWPADDVHCKRVVFKMANDLKLALQHTPQKRVVVQAGGNCGAWPVELAKHFTTVYTFEPHPVNFAALAINTASLPNVVKMQAALGYEPGLVHMELPDHEANNAGAYRVAKGGMVPVLALDALHLPVVDLLYLDIEGFEWQAIRGALKTIDRCKPTVAVEDKGLSEQYGTPMGYIEKKMDELFGYAPVAKVHRDVIFRFVG